jgi:hypothetical protein
MSRGLESASAPLRNGNRCWVRPSDVPRAKRDGFRWNRSKNSKLKRLRFRHINGCGEKPVAVSQIHERLAPCGRLMLDPGVAAGKQHNRFGTVPKVENRSI